jgi:choline dehydrogenase
MGQIKMHWSAFLGLLLAVDAVSIAYGSGVEHYDAVIVGGGPSGFVLASRLSENPAFNVLLLESGPETYTNETVTTPRYAGRLQGTQFSWNFTSTPQSRLNGATPFLHQGHGLGGGSAINIMAYCRGSSSVFDEWAERSGNEGLRWKSLIEYFEKSTQLFIPAERPYEQAINVTGLGNDHVHVSYDKTGQYIPADSFFVDTWIAYGAKAANLTAGDGIGMIVGGPKAINAENATRSYALPAYGFELANRPNVKLLHSSRVTKVNFRGTQAVGVDYVSLMDNITHTVESEETIITAGAVNSPRLLLLSGVGPKDHLEEVGIPVVVENDQVGQNLFDHHYTITMFNATQTVITSSQLADPGILASAQAEYRENATGPLSNPGGSSFFAERIPDEVLDSFGVNVTFHKSLPKDRPHLLYQYTASAMIPALVPAGANPVSAFVALVQPEAPGTLRLRSANWRDEPLLDPNYYGSAADFALAVHGYQRLLNMTRSAALVPIHAGEIYPGAGVAPTGDAAAVAAALRPVANSFHHPVGSCALGRVLDAHFAVRGARNLRVVDSSAIPVPPTCHSQAPVYALAEFAAAMLQEQFWFK